MRFLLVLVCGCLSLAGCAPERDEIRVWRWFPLSHTTERFRLMQPDRPLVILCYSDWGLVGQLMLRHHEQADILELFTEHRVLPILANVTDHRGFGVEEIQKLDLKFNGSECLIVLKPNGEKSFLPTRDMDLSKLDQSMLNWLRERLR